MRIQILRLVVVVLGLTLAPAAAWGAPAWQRCKDSKAWKAADANGDYPYLVFFHTDNPASTDAREVLSSPEVNKAIKGTTCFSIQLSAAGADRFMTKAVGGDATAPALFVVTAATRYRRVDLDQDAAAIAKALEPLKMTAAEVLAFYESQQARPTEVKSDEGWSLTLPPHWQESDTKNQYVGPFEENTFPDNINVVKTPPNPPPKPTQQVREGVQKQIQASVATYKLRNVSTQKYGDKEALLIDGQFVAEGRNVSMYQAVFDGLVVTCTIDSEREKDVWPQCQTIFNSVSIGN